MPELLDKTREQSSHLEVFGMRYEEYVQWLGEDERSTLFLQRLQNPEVLSDAERDEYAITPRAELLLRGNFCSILGGAASPLFVEHVTYQLADSLQKEEESGVKVAKRVIIAGIHGGIATGKKHIWDPFKDCNLQKQGWHGHYTPELPGGGDWHHLEESTACAAGATSTLNTEKAAYKHAIQIQQQVEALGIQNAEVWIVEMLTPLRSSEGRVRIFKTPSDILTPGHNKRHPFKENPCDYPLEQTTISIEEYDRLLEEGMRDGVEFLGGGCGDGRFMWANPPHKNIQRAKLQSVKDAQIPKGKQLDRMARGGMNHTEVNVTVLDSEQGAVAFYQQTQHPSLIRRGGLLLQDLTYAGPLVLKYDPRVVANHPEVVDGIVKVTALINYEQQQTSFMSRPQVYMQGKNASELFAIDSPRGIQILFTKGWLSNAIKGSLKKMQGRVPNWLVVPLQGGPWSPHFEQPVYDIVEPDGRGIRTYTNPKGGEYGKILPNGTLPHPLLSSIGVDLP